MDKCKDEKIYVYLTFFGWEVVGICVLVYRNMEVLEIVYQEHFIMEIVEYCGIKHGTCIV
jgi:hypothetical protein